MRDERGCLQAEAEDQVRDDRTPIQAGAVVQVREEMDSYPVGISGPGERRN